MFLAALHLLPALMCAQDTSAVDAVRSAYTANREALGSFGSLRFERTEGVIEEPVDAFDEGLSQKKWKRQMRGYGRLLFDGPRVLFETLIPHEEELRWRQKLRAGTYMMWLESFRALTDGTTEVYDVVGLATDGQTELHTPKLEEVAPRWGHYGRLPLSLGVPPRSDHNLGYALGPQPPERMGWTLESTSDATLGGQTLFKVTLVGKYKNRLIFWVDLERGAIPIRVRWITPDGKFYEQEEYEDIRWIDDRGWFPFRKLGYSAEEPGGNRIHVWELVVTQADFAHAPPRESFRLEFPKPMHLIHNQKMTLNGPRAVWDLDSLNAQSLNSGRRMSMPEPVAQGPVMPSARELQPWWWTWSLWTVGAILIAVGGLTAWRRRPHAHP
jgi:hypothetical protein